MTARMAADFVALVCDRAASASGMNEALVLAARALRGPGADTLVAAVRTGAPGCADELDRLASTWGAACLNSLAAVTRTDGIASSGMRDYLVGCALADATRSIPADEAGAEGDSAGG